MRDGDRIVVVVYGVPFARAPRLISLVRSRVEMRLHMVGDIFGRRAKRRAREAMPRKWPRAVTDEWTWRVRVCTCRVSA